MCSYYICGSKICALCFLHIFLGIFNACMCKIMKQKSYTSFYVVIFTLLYFMHIYLYFPVIRHLASTRGTLLFPACPPASLTAHNWSSPPLVSSAALFTFFSPFRNYR